MVEKDIFISNILKKNIGKLRITKKTSLDIELEELDRCVFDEIEVISDIEINKDIVKRYELQFNNRNILFEKYIKEINYIIDNDEVMIKNFKSLNFSNIQIAKIAEKYSKKFSNSRYFYGPIFSYKLGMEIYSEWIKNSFNGYADDIFFILDKDVEKQNLDKLIGFATIKKVSDKIIRLDLISINKKNKGYGKLMMNFLFNYYSERGYQILKTGTQVGNTNAVKFYEKIGMNKTNEIYIYNKIKTFKEEGII